MTPALTVIDLSAVDVASGGAIWSLPHGGDLDANLVRLSAGGLIADHVNDDVDVLMSVRDGSGELVIEGTAFPLAADILALVPRGAERRIVAGEHGLAYLSIHRSRGPLEVGGSSG